jgi:hypothetical protein
MVGSPLCWGCLEQCFEELSSMPLYSGIMVSASGTNGTSVAATTWGMAWLVKARCAWSGPLRNYFPEPRRTCCWRCPRASHRWAAAAQPLRTELAHSATPARHTREDPSAQAGSHELPARLHVLEGSLPGATLEEETPPTRSAQNVPPVDEHAPVDGSETEHGGGYGLSFSERGAEPTLRSWPAPCHRRYPAVGRRPAVPRDVLRHAPKASQNLTTSATVWR